MSIYLLLLGFCAFVFIALSFFGLYQVKGSIPATIGGLLIFYSAIMQVDGMRSGPEVWDDMWLIVFALRMLASMLLLIGLAQYFFVGGQQKRRKRSSF